MARRRLPALELLHGVEGKVAKEAGARAWMRGKWDEKKGTERRPTAFQAARWHGAEWEKREGALLVRPRGEGGGKMGALAQRSAARGDQQWPLAVGRGRWHCRVNREGGEGGHERRGAGG
jgi:hypothetical protein